MSEPIKKGDLTYVAKWPCCGAFLGYPMKVAEIAPASENDGNCGLCGAYVGKMSTGHDEKHIFPLPWLRKFDPLSEPESIETKEEIPA